MLRRVFKQKLNNTMRLSYSLRDKNISGPKVKRVDLENKQTSLCR